MKTLLYTFVVLSIILIPIISRAQCPAPGDLYFGSQSEVNDFAINFPGCTVISGNVEIEGGDITDLSPLGNILSIQGFVEIGFNDQLTSLQGLENLQSIEGYLSFTDNNKLTSLQGLDNLQSVGGNLTFDRNAQLTSMQGLDNLESIGGDLAFKFSGSITSMQGLNNLKSIGGDLDIFHLHNLTSLQGLTNLQSIDGVLSINDNKKLSSLEGLDNLTTIGNTLYIVSPALIEVDLERLSTVGGQIVIRNNTSLTTIKLNNLIDAKNDLIVKNNPLLTTLQLNNLTSVKSNFYIQNNEQLTSLSGIKNLNYVGSIIGIIGNEQLTSIQGLETIDPENISILYINFNPQLSYCDLENICTFLSGDDLGLTTIAGNGPGCKNLKTVQLACLPEVVSIAPLAEIILECPAGSQDLPAMVGVTYDDNSSGNVMVNWDLSNFNGQPGSFTLTGMLDLMGIATNPGNLTAQISVSVEDTQAPVPEITQLPVLIGECSVSVSQAPMATDTCMGKVIGTTNDTLQYDKQGTYTITWTYDDGNGNTTSQKQTVVVNTYSLPEIKCPETNIVSCESVVNFDLPTASDACSPLTVIQTDGTGLTSGSVFPVGVTSLTFRTSNANGSDHCAIRIEVLPDLDIQHVSGVHFGDTIHIADCVPPDISKDDLDLGSLRKGSSLRSNVYSADLPEPRPYGMWKVLKYVYEVTDRCEVTESFVNYVSLYDLNPPVFQYFPDDITINTPSELPPVSLSTRGVEILDICRYVAWDTITTKPIIDPLTSDTLAFVRRWMAADEVGNKSFRDQLIYIRDAMMHGFGSIKAHIIKESDLVKERFHDAAGTNDISFRLYRKADSTFTYVQSAVSENWQGSNGTVSFTPVIAGEYRIKVNVPTGYAAIHPDSLIHTDGWSDIFILSEDSTLNLGTILLIPDMESDTISAFPKITDPGLEVASRNEYFTLYPNPTTGKLKISMQNRKNIDYTIFNHLGQAVLKGMADDGSEIDLSDQTDGMYFIRLEKGEFTRTERVLLLTQ